MLDWHRSHSAQFPRQKIYLSSLSQLMQRKVVMQPQAEVSSKIFPQRNFAKKLSLNHQRIRSNIQLRSHKFDLHWSSKKTKDMAVENNRVPSQHSKRLKKDNEEAMKLQFRSTQLTPNTMLVPTTARPLTQSAHSSNFPERRSYRQDEVEDRPDSPHKNFLRKGSNLQKQIVVNLLRNKLVKQRELNEKREYSNHQIIKMIQVFKGVTITQTKMKKDLISEHAHFSQPRKKVDPMKDIRGWQNEMHSDHEEQVPQGMNQFELNQPQMQNISELQ